MWHHSFGKKLSDFGGWGGHCQSIIKETGKLPSSKVYILCNYNQTFLWICFMYRFAPKKRDGHVLVIRVPLNSAGRRQGLISVVLCDFPLNLLYHDQTAKPPILLPSEKVQPYKPTWGSDLIFSYIRSRFSNQYLNQSQRLAGPDTWYLTIKIFVIQRNEIGGYKKGEGGN